MIRAAFFDIDGTLVSLKRRVYPPSARTVIEALRKQGILCFVATGRSKFEIVEEGLLEGLTFDGLLTNNGQDAYAADGTLLYGKPLDSADVEAILHWTEKTGTACWMVSAEKSMISQVDARVQEAMKVIHTRCPRLGDLRSMLSKPVFKIVLFLNRAEMAAPTALLRHSRVTQWYEYGCDIISQDGGKAPAMLEILRRYGLSPAEAIAFGDGENDIEMLQAAGVGVAMGNATPECKAAADYITTDCDEDGLLNALRHFMRILDE